MSGLNLHALARQVVQESTSPEPGVMVREFVALIPPEQYRDALTYLARELITSVIRARRTSQNGGTAPSVQGSRKVQAAREAWRRLLDTPEFVPSANAWIFLRDATRSQVLEMAAMRQEKSNQLAAVADRYRRLAGLMQSTGAMTVGNLPDQQLSTILDPAAAAA